MGREKIRLSSCGGGGRGRGDNGAGTVDGESGVTVVSVVLVVLVSLVLVPVLLGRRAAAAVVAEEALLLDLNLIENVLDLVGGVQSHEGGENEEENGKVLHFEWI